MRALIPHSDQRLWGIMEQGDPWFWWILFLDPVVAHGETQAPSAESVQHVSALAEFQWGLIPLTDPLQHCNVNIYCILTELQRYPCFLSFLLLILNPKVLQYSTEALFIIPNVLYIMSLHLFILPSTEVRVHCRSVFSIQVKLLFLWQVLHTGSWWWVTL